MRWRGAAVGLVGIADLIGGGNSFVTKYKLNVLAFISDVAYYLHKQSVSSVKFTLEQPTSVIR